MAEPGHPLLTLSRATTCQPAQASAHQFLNRADEPPRLLVCSAPVTGPSAAGEAGRAVADPAVGSDAPPFRRTLS
jgi:hypothetical protein